MSVRTDTVNLIINVNGSAAQNELNGLRKRAADLTFEMKNNLKKGTQEYIAAAAELKNVNATMAELKKSIGITALSQKELSAELNKLKALRGSVAPFSKEFKDLSTQIAATEKRLYDVRNNVQGLASVFSKVKDEVKQFGAMAAAYLGFQFIASQFKNIITGAGKLSDQLADIRRVAGLSAEEVGVLNKSLSKLDTRTGMTGLREIAIIAGKLGVAKEDIAGFTKAVDMLVVTLGDELGNADEITTKLGKILNVFDGKVTGENVTKLGNAFVELANSGVATGGFISEFDQRLSGIAKSANISLGALSGLGAGMEELGSRVESSTTAIQKLLIHIAADIPKAAKIAGQSTEEFGKLFATNATEALLKFSEGLVKNKSSFDEIVSSLKDAGEEGARVVETISKMGTSADTLRQRIALGVSSIKEESAIIEGFALKNETLGASLDKLGKEFYRFVMQSGVSNFLKGAVQSTIDFIKWLKELPRWIEENRIALTTLITGFMLMNKQMILSNLLWVANKAAVVAGTIAQYAAAAATLAYRVALLSLAAVQALVTGNITRAQAAWKLLNQAFKASPIGLVVAGVIALGIALDNAFSKMSRMQKAQEEFNKRAIEQYGDQVNKIEQLKAALESENVGFETKKKLYQELIAINPAFAETLRLDAEGHLHGAEAVNEYIKMLKKKGEMQAAQELSNEKNKDVMNAQSEVDMLMPKFKSGNISTQDLIKIGKANETLQAAKEAKKYFDDKLQELYKNGSSDVTFEFTQPADTVIGKKSAIDASVAARRAWLEKQIDDLKAAFEKLNLTDSEGQRKNLELRKKYQDELDRLDGKEKKDRKKKGNDNLLKEAESFYKELLRLKKDAEAAAESDNAKELATLQDKYQKLHDKALEFLKKNVTSRKKYTEEEKLIVGAFNTELATLQKKQFEKHSEEEYTKSLEDTRQYFNDQRNLEGQNYAKGIINKIQYDAELKALDLQEKAQLVTIAQDYSNTSKKADKDLFNFKKDLEKATTENEIIEAEKRFKTAQEEALAKAKLAVLAAPDGSKKRIDAQKALLQLQFDQETLFLDKKSEVYQLKEKDLQDAIAAIDDEAKQRRIQAIDEFAQQVLGITNNLMNALNNLGQREYQKDKALNDAKKNNYKKQLDAKLISQRQYDAKVAKADEELAKKKHDLDMKAFKRQQALAIVGALINGAMAVTSTLAARPGLADIFSFGTARAIQVGLVVAATAAQVAAIATQAPPEAAEGNWFRKGKKHKDGGIHVNIERDEAVIKADAMTDKNKYTVTGTPAQITSKLNSMHGGVNWVQGALIQMPKFRERPAQLNPNLPRIMEQGGVVRPLNQEAATGNKNNESLLRELINKQDELITEVKNQKDRLHAVVSIKEYRDIEKKYDNAKKVSGMNQ